MCRLVAGRAFPRPGGGSRAETLGKLAVGSLIWLILAVAAFWP